MGNSWGWCILGVAAVVASSGCSADVNDGTSDGAAATGESHAADGVCNQASSPGLKVEWLEPSGNEQRVRVSNLRDVEGTFKVTRAVVTPKGTESTALGGTRIGAGESTVIPLPAVDERARREGSSLHVVGQAEFADGLRASDTARLALAPAQSKAVITSGDAGPAGVVIPSGLITTRICFEYPGTFDAGNGEDYFTEGVPTYRPAYGLRVSMSTTSFTYREFLDENGCTPMQTFPLGSYSVRLYSGGQIGNAYFEVADDAIDSKVQEFNFGILLLATDSPTYRFDPTTTSAADAFNAAQAAGWVMKRLAFGDPPDLLLVANATNTSKSNYSSKYKVIALQPGDHDNKFVIAHEMGHWASDVYSDFPTATVCGSHDAISVENQGCALQEALGNWWAAMAFNNTIQSDCRYRGVDCDKGLSIGGSCTTKSKLTTAVMETCNPGIDLSGAGNETDWSRVLWNMRASFGASPSAILAWIDSANDSNAWTPTNVYTLLDARANAIGGVVNTRFDGHKLVHGIDH